MGDRGGQALISPAGAGEKSLRGIGRYGEGKGLFYYHHGDRRKSQGELPGSEPYCGALRKRAVEAVQQSLHKGHMGAGRDSGRSLPPTDGAPLTGNTIHAETYIEEGYLPQWKAYQEWLGRTLNRRLLALELGEDFRMPKLIRWPFEKTVFFNKKAHMYRVNQTFAQISEEIGERAVSIKENSVDFIVKAAEEAAGSSR